MTVFHLAMISAAGICAACAVLSTWLAWRARHHDEPHNYENDRIIVKYHEGELINCSVGMLSMQSKLNCGGGNLFGRSWGPMLEFEYRRSDNARLY